MCGHRLSAVWVPLLGFALAARQSAGLLSLDWAEAAEARPCTPVEVLRALGCFRWVQPSSPITALWYMCEHPSPRSLKLHNITAKPATAVADLCCRCFAKFALVQRALVQESARVKTKLLVEEGTLRNLSAQLASPLIFGSPARYDEARVASKQFKSIFGHFLRDAWSLSTSLLALVEDSTDYDIRTLEGLVADALILARINAGDLRELLLQTGNVCLPNIFQRSCTADHLEVFHLFPPIAGPEPKDHALDFLGQPQRQFVCAAVRSSGPTLR